MVYHFIYNPIAGKGLSKTYWDTIGPFIKNIRLNYQLHETKSVGHAEVITKYLTMQTEPKTIIVLGGDGTLGEVVNGIQKFHNVYLSCIPCGSGNDFATTTNLPKSDPITILKYILTNKSRPINFMNVNDRRSINICGFGLDTDILHTYYKMKSFLPNKVCYKLATILRSLFFKWHLSEVSVDGGEWQSLKTLLLTVGNGTSIGGGIKMCPLAKIDDDWLDFTYIGHFPRINTICNLRKVLKGKVLKLRFVRCVRCKTVEMRLPNKTYQYDGNIVENTPILKVSLAKEKINFIG